MERIRSLVPGDGARRALWVLTATGIANVLAYVYQVVMARLLRPADYASLTALLGILILEQLSAQVIQSGAARIVARYRALGSEEAVRGFVRRWSRWILMGVAPPSILVAALAPLVGALLSLPVVTVVILALALFISVPLTFAGGVLQGLGWFGWFGWYFIVQAVARLGVGVLLVAVGFGVTGAFGGALAALVAGALFCLVPLRPLFRSDDRVRAAGVRAGEGRFLAGTAAVMLAYAALTNLDAVAGRALLPAADAGAYAAAITMAKVVLFAPVAIGFLLLEHTARAHARGEGTDRALYLALAFALSTSGPVAVAYALAPEFFTRLIAGAQYGATAGLIGPYAFAALLNALLSVWVAHFIGLGELRIGALVAAAVLAEIALIAVSPHEAIAFVRIMVTVAGIAQIAAVTTYLALRRGRRSPAPRVFA